MHIYDTIRKRINRAVAMSGKSRMQVAKDAGVSYPNLCRFINGKRDGLGVDVLVKLSKELKVPVGFFFGEIDGKQKKDLPLIDYPNGLHNIIQEYDNLSEDDKKRVEKIMVALVNSFK